MPAAFPPSPSPLIDQPSGRRVFVSYTDADRAWAEWIAWQLEAAGHKVKVQAWDFQTGNFIEHMNHALAWSDRVLAVCSDAYFASPYTRDEWTAALVRDRGQPDRLLLVRVEPCTVPPVIATRIWADLFGVDEATAAKRLLANVAGARGKPSVAPAFPGRRDTVLQKNQPPFPGMRPAISNSPPRNPHFTGRADLLTELEEQLATSGAAALVAAHGLGGVGKTQLALEYTHRNASRYELVWWVTADTYTSAVTSIDALARRLGLEVEADLEATADKVVEVLRRRTGWLLLFDNAEDPGVVYRLLPAGGGGHVLVTSRNPTFGQLGAKVQVDVWPTEVAAGFLLERTGDRDQQAARELAETLGGLPLALAQAAAYCEQASLDLADYLPRYRHRRRELLARGDLIDYPETVATTWQLNLDQLQTNVPAAVELLRLCAFLAPDTIPLELLTVPDYLPPVLSTVVGDELALDEAVAGLHRFSLLRRDRGGFGLHRLVQTVVRESLTGEQTRQWAGIAVRLVKAALPQQPDDPRQWAQCAALMAHVQAVANHARACNAVPEDIAGLLDHVKVYVWSRAELAAARASFSHDLGIKEAWAGREYPQVATAMENLGWVLQLLRKPDDDEEMVDEEMDDEHTLGELLENSLDILLKWRKLRAARSDAELPSRWWPDQGKRHPEPDNPLSNTTHYLVHDSLTILESDTGFELEGLRELGIVLERLESLDGVYERLEGDLSLTESCDPDPGIAIRFSIVMPRLRELIKVRGQFAHALAVLETVYRDERPEEVARTLVTLGKKLIDVKELTEARKQFARALEIYQKTLGPGHIYTQEAESLLCNLPTHEHV